MSPSIVQVSIHGTSHIVMKIHSVISPVVGCRQVINVTVCEWVAVRSLVHLVAGQAVVVAGSFVSLVETVGSPVSSTNGAGQVVVV